MASWVYCSIFIICQRTFNLFEKKNVDLKIKVHKEIIEIITNCLSEIEENDLTTINRSVLVLCRHENRFEFKRIC